MNFGWIKELLDSDYILLIIYSKVPHSLMNRLLKAKKLYRDIQYIYILDQPEVIYILYDWREFFDNYLKTQNPLFSK